MIEKVSALAVENALGLDLDGYVDAVTRGEVWPKPVFTTNGELGERRPGWARGVSFDVAVERSDDKSKVLVSYAAPGQGVGGGGFAPILVNVLVCVSIEVKFNYSEVELYSAPAVVEVECPADVQKYYGGEVVTLAEVLAAGS